MKKFLGLTILRYFRSLARRKLAQNPRAILIGVTGSSGKSSTRLALARILAVKGVVKHSAHANSESGIPLNILNLTPHNYSLLDWLRLILLAPWKLHQTESYDYYIAEMGVDSPDEPKNMGYLLSILRPHVAVVLGVGLVHTAAFDKLVKDRDPARRLLKLRAAIAAEKMQLAQALPTTGTAVINADDPPLASLLGSVRARILTFGYSRQSSLRFTGCRVSRTGFRLHFTYQNQNYVFSLPDPLPTHYAYTFGAAIATAASLGISPTKSLEALSNYRAPAGRLRVFAGVHDTHLIDSSYNASPVTMRQSLELLSSLGGRARKIAVLGDMRELGSSAKSTHKQLVEPIIASADEAILFGPLMAEYVVPVLSRRRFPVHHFARMSELVTYLEGRLAPHSWVLFKGSQNTILLERAVAAVLASPQDQQWLCRRGPYWDRIRAQAP